MRVLVRPLLYGLILYAVFFSGLGAIGFVGPDEPRYADVARAMLRSGDYITPRLFGEPWFEKPPLYYWLAALFFRLGIDEISARLPSAVAAAAFLALWFWFADKYYSRRAAILSSIMLGTSAGYIGFARAAAMDMLLTATLGAALVFLAIWLWDDEPRALYWFYAFLGLATLAKGPLAVGLAGLLFAGFVAHYRHWRAIRHILLTPALACFAVVALPWYLLCYRANGQPFFQEFFIKHNVERFTSAAAIGHGQPFWFYVPVIVAAIFPWSPLLLLPARQILRNGWEKTFESPRITFLACWVVLPFTFFSLSQNKLPGYLLPLLPPLTLWIASALETEAPSHESGATAFNNTLLGCAALLLLALPALVLILPDALAAGLSHTLRELSVSALWRQLARGPFPAYVWILILLLIALAIFSVVQQRLLQAAIVIAVAIAISVLSVTKFLAGGINRVASVKSVAARLASLGVPASSVGEYYITRNQVYGLSFYLDGKVWTWSPGGNPSVALVAAQEDVRVDEIAPGAAVVSYFPGQRLRLWLLPPALHAAAQAGFTGVSPSRSPVE